jgi:signal peptidase I
VSTDLPSPGQPGPVESVGLKEPAADGASPPGPGEPPVADNQRRPPGRRRPSLRRRLFEWLIIAAIAVSVALLLRIFVVQTFYIPSPSMTPTLKVGDRILVNKLAYRLHGVGRGDIIVFRRPPAEDCGTPVTDLVKRVIGLPGETISDKNGTVFIDGRVLAQPWLPKNDPNTYTPSFGPVKIGPNSYFVMGDDRTVSCDSRYWGTVSRSLIIGKVEMRIWPIRRFAFF